MSMTSNIPNYADLFGSIDFKTGDEQRSVYSPAAYLTDLLQLLDDEFDADSLDFDSRREDIKTIDLDAENTTTLIPYLDVVNEVLEGRIDSDSDAVYEKLENAAYPFNMPFSLDSEKLKNHLKHLGISTPELRHLFATSAEDYTAVAQASLGLSQAEWNATAIAAGDDADIFEVYGYTDTEGTGADGFVSSLSVVSTFMETTDLAAEEMLALLYQNLYIEPSDRTDVEAGREYFYINTGLGNGAGYVALTTDETELRWYDADDNETESAVPIEWFDRVSRFVRLAHKTGLSFPDLDRILRHCCQGEDGTPTLSEDTLVYVAQVVYIHKTLEQPVNTVVAIASKLSYQGRTNADLPQDQFNQIFNLPCVSIDEKYFHIETETGKLPKQYEDTTYHKYTQIEYYEDLFSDDNDSYRQRLRHALGFTETDLLNITERLEFEEVADSSLWEKNDDSTQWQLLNVLYRIHALSKALDVHFLELFILFDLLEQDPFIGRSDPQTYFVYQPPSTQKCFEILMAPTTDENHSISDQLWLLESLMALVKWMKALGYSAEMLWAIVNGAPMTDKAEEEQNMQDLALYNALLQSFKASEMQPDTLEEALGDKRAARFAFNLMRSHQQKEIKAKKSLGFAKPFHCKHGHKQQGGYQKRSRRSFKKHFKKLGMHHMPSMRHKQHMHPAAYLNAAAEEMTVEYSAQGYHQPIAERDQSHLLVTYKPQEIQALTRDFIQQLDSLYESEFVDLQLEQKLQEKLVKNLVNHQIIDGSGKILTQHWMDGQLPAMDDFQIEFDFSGIKRDVFEIIRDIYDGAIASQLDAGDDLEVQVFKSDFEPLGLSAAEVRELYDNLSYNGYMDEQGFVTNVNMFSGAYDANLALNAGLEGFTHKIYHLLAKQLDKFHASRVQVSDRVFADLPLDQTKVKALLVNLQMNGYVDRRMFVVNKMRIVNASPKRMKLALPFYPHRDAIVDALQKAIAADQTTWLQLDPSELSKLAAPTVSEWVHADLQALYLSGDTLRPDAAAFFREESNREQFELRPYFESAARAIVFDRIASIISYADQYRLQDEKLADLDFKPEEIESLKQALTAIDVLDEQGVLRSDRIPFLLVPENAAAFRVRTFEDYDLDIFFQLHEIAKAIDTTVQAIDRALRAHTQNQQAATIEQLQGVLGIESNAVEALSKAIFKTEDNLHAAWLQPLLAEVNALGQLDELPSDMHYTQAVKRVRQLALLAKQQQLDINEITLALKDQDLVAKFPEDLILPDDSEGDSITSVDALLEVGEFVYLFNGSDYWIYLSENYTLIDKKEIDLDNEDDRDLVDLQKEDETLQKRLKEDPIRQLFEEEDLAQVDAAFIDSYGTWVIVSGTSHYVKYANSNAWDKRSNSFGQVDNDFDNLEMIDSAYVDLEGRLFLFANDKYVRYSVMPSSLSDSLSVDRGYPKSIAEDWNAENLPVQLPVQMAEQFSRDLGPMFDGIDGNSYAFSGDLYISSEEAQTRSVAGKWGHQEYNFGHHPTRIQAALASGGDYYLFLENKIAKYSGSLELANLQPEDGYPKGIHQEFAALPDEFLAGIDSALGSWDDTIYLFRDDEYVSLSTDADGNRVVSDAADTRSYWGKVANDIAESGTVDAAFVGLDGYSYLFSGSQYFRYASSDYSQVDDGFPRNIKEDWEGLETVTAAFVLGNKTYLFGTDENEDSVYVRYSTLRKYEDDYLEVDEEDPNARVIETVLANRPDVDEIEVFPASINDDFWSLPDSVTDGAEDFQIDAVMNGPEGKVYLFYHAFESKTEAIECYYIEHDHASRWWSEPTLLSDQWDRTITTLDYQHVTAALMGQDGKTYLFYKDKYIRFSDAELRNVDNGYPRSTHKFWGKVRNNIERTGQVDAALIVESRWEEQDDDGRLVDITAKHTYLFSGDQFCRYLHENDEDSAYAYDTVEPGYPRALHRLSEEPRFRGLQTSFPRGIDAAFADQRQVYLFEGDRFHVVVGDEDNYKQYGGQDDSQDETRFANVQAATQERGTNYLLMAETDEKTEIEIATWYRVNHLEDLTLTKTEATPRTVQQAEDILAARAMDKTDVSAVLHGLDGKRYVFAGKRYYDVELEDDFPIEEVWGRSRNPIYDQETIDAAFVGRDGITYVFSGEWFVQYESDTYIGQNVTYPPRRIQDKWRGLNNVALAYVWKEDTYLLERPDANGNFRYLRYVKDSYEQPVPLQTGNSRLWNIPADYQQDGFDSFDTIFVHEDNLIFISDQKFISFNLNTENWSFPQPLSVLYPGIPFNKTDFQTLKSGFVGADGTTVYFFNQASYVTYSGSSGTWSEVADIKNDWGLQANILRNGVDAAWASASDRATYLFAGDSYVRYSSDDYRYVDEGYPKAIATYLRDEPAFAFMTKEFQQHLDTLEARYDGEAPFFTGLLDNGRCLYFFTEDTVFTSSAKKYVAYDINGLGQVENNFTSGGYVDAAFVTESVDDDGADTYLTYLFSGEQYIRYTTKQALANSHRGDYYRYVDEGYPKVTGEGLLEEAALKLETLPEDYRNGIDAAFYSTDLGLVFFNETNYLHVDSTAENTQGNINEVWGNLVNTFTDEPEAQTLDGAYVDAEGRLLVFKGEQFVRYSDTAELFALNPYDEPRYIDAEFPENVEEIWPQLDESILTGSGVDTVFRFEDEIYFHTGTDFVKYNLDLSDRDEEKPVQVLAYRWGEWSDYLLSDIHAIARFKDLNQRFTSGEISLTELVSGANGEVREPYMHFAAIFGFEKEEVRWVKQRNAFLADRVNSVEEEFQLELVLRLYDILATTQRLRVDVSDLYNNVWLNLYGSGSVDIGTAASGAYDLLVSTECNNNYETLVQQINNEVNTLKRDALVPYVIAHDADIATPRQLYQKLLIDIQMDSQAETSRIKEATAAVQLYMHRYFMNLEALDLNSSDPEAMKATLKERWEWLQNYRVWEANRKVFLYPENYIRPELRDSDDKSEAFEALEDSLNQGKLTEDLIEEAYLTYLDTFTEVSELTIAGGYVYDDAGADSSDKVLVLFGRTRTDPMRYFYRFATFVNGDSSAITWQPWEELNISIEVTHVKPVYAFDRLFIFWTVVEESSEDPASAVVTTSENSDGDQTVSTEGNSQHEVKVYYSFYNLNKRWSQPQLLQTSFEESSYTTTAKVNNTTYKMTDLKTSLYISDADVFVENASKLSGYEYENIYISVRFYLSDTYGDENPSGPYYRAYNLTPELYSQEADTQSIENRGQELFEELFPAEGSIEEDNVAMLSYSDNSVDGPWFAYNHNGCGFLVKPDAIALSDDTALNSLSDNDLFSEISEDVITAAVQVPSGEVYYFLENGNYISVTASSEGNIVQGSEAISSRWGIENQNDMQVSGTVDSAYVLDDSVYLTLNGNVYEYDGSSLSTLVAAPYALKDLIEDVPETWSNVDAAFRVGAFTLWFNNATGTALLTKTHDVFVSLSTNTDGPVKSSSSSVTSVESVEDVFGLSIGVQEDGVQEDGVQEDTNESTIQVDRVDAALIGTGKVGSEEGALYLFCGEDYLRYSVETEDSFSCKLDEGYPKSIVDNTEGLPQWTQIDAAFTSSETDDNGDYITYLFNNQDQTYYRSDTGETLTTVNSWGVISYTNLQIEERVDAAYIADNYLYLLVNTKDSSGDETTEYYRYSLADGGTPDEYFDSGYPKAFSPQAPIDAAFALTDDSEDSYVYFFSGTDYYRLEKNASETTEIGSPSSIAGSWGNIPSDIRSAGITAALNYAYNGEEKLYLLQNDNYLAYDINENQAEPYEIDNTLYEVIRLTSSTAEPLNQILFAGGIESFLQMDTQEINESPTISFEVSSPDNIQMNSKKFSTEPINSHLDFTSANGLYYWEIFFHAPFLIAQALNTDQQFEYAKKWYEYIFDPTAASNYWKFLPFLSVDPEALIATLENDLTAFSNLLDTNGVDTSDVNNSEVAYAQKMLEALAAVLAPYQAVFLGQVDLAVYESGAEDTLADIESWSTYIDLTSAVGKLETEYSQLSTSDNALLVTWKSEIEEVLEIIKKLDYRLTLMSSFSAQLATYLDDPFDPHAIAGLRPIAYRKTIVMRYVDNLLDWGDMLFRQYSRESISEARMLYILAYDLLGEKPENLGQVVLKSTKSYSELIDADADVTNYDFLIDLENSTTTGVFAGETEYGLSFAAAQFDSIINPYFYLKENELFTEYWTRVEDRLGKIRACLNIDGVAQPLPLFQPPIDPAALVNAVASGGGVAAAAAMAAGAASVPDYRFSSLMTKARELVGKLNSFSDALLGALEKEDAEALSLLQNQHEGIILDLNTFIKEEQIKEAQQSKENLLETQRSAQAQLAHYTGLISEGYLSEEETQMRMMYAAASLHSAVALGKIISGLSYVVPQFTAGPFSFGVTTGGRDYGSMLDKFGDAVESSAEATSMFGEVAGIVAQYKRSEEDWRLQKTIANSEIVQINYQLAAQDHSIAISQRELLTHTKELENHEAIAVFLKSKFSNQALYSWMSGKISGLFYQTYKLAHDYAKQAEQAFIFEKGLEAGRINYINGMYWDTQRKGLLSGSSLALDLDRMEKAYLETDSRRLEITKNISLIELDPMALLELKTKGVCQFRLSEALFDYDFPGHYNRQIKTISLAFDVGEGQHVNATLTQLSSKLVMATDIKAVKHLIDPANEATTNVRVNWRANQQVALSHTDQYTENSGMFELNFGDERYLPFEGTGAVSNWRLELNGTKGAYNPADLLDVTIKLRYTAKQGGSRFANEVKGVLKPYHATSFFDLAYNFPDQWVALTEGDSDEVDIAFTQAMFPNMSSSKIIGLFVRYEYTDGESGATFTINNDLPVPNNTYLQPNTLSVGQSGSEWTFALEGDRSTLKNAEMVLVYKAKV